jgi:CDP-diacylglycerol--serine O-phosphatidyltransferase
MSGALQPGRGPGDEIRRDETRRDDALRDEPRRDEAGRVSPMRLLHRRLRPRPRPRFKGPSFNRLVPNIMTLIGLCAGLTGMRYALDGRFGAAAVAITVAGAIDGLDGRLARLLKAASRFGAEFDSLADFLCFGVAPAFVLYLWSLHRAGAFGFIPCMMFAVCMALRLARFNAALDSAPGPAYAYNFFTGVPAPAGAGLVLFPLFVGLEARTLGWDWLLRIASYPLVCAVVLVGIALLLVSTLPVWSFKNFKMPAEYVLPTFLGVGVFAALLVADPWAALAAAGLIYIGMLPFSVRSFRRLKREAESMREPPDQAQAG